MTCFIEDMAKFYKVRNCIHTNFHCKDIFKFKFDILHTSVLFVQNEGSETFYPPKTSLEFPITREKMKTIIRSHPQIYKNDSYLYMTRPFEVVINTLLLLLQTLHVLI